MSKTPICIFYSNFVVCCVKNRNPMALIFREVDLHECYKHTPHHECYRLRQRSTQHTPHHECHLLMRTHIQSLPKPSPEVVVADLIAVSCYPVVIVTRVSGLWLSLGPSWCSVLGFVNILFLTLRYMTMSLLSFDRFGMVFFPFTYPFNGNKIMLALSSAVWLTSLLIAASPLFLQCLGFQKISGFCGVSIFCSSGCHAWRYVQDSVIFVGGALLPIILYSSMFWKARQLNNRVRDIAGSQAQADESARRARYTFLFLFLTLGGCSLPQFGNAMLAPLKKSFAEVYWTYAGLSVIALFATVVLDPLVIIKHEDFRRCALKLLKLPQTRATATIIPVLPSTIEHRKSA